MTTTLVGGASTQSRARRPLPEGIAEARTVVTHGAVEHIEFRAADSNVWHGRDCITWVVGQGGLLWGGPLFPNHVLGGFQDHDTARLFDVPGSYGHAAEHELADALGAVYDPLFQGQPLGVRFWSNGSDACSAAARIARAVTGREPIASYGYHGAHADYAHYPQYHGVPRTMVDLHQRFEWGDRKALRALAEASAALIVEVPPCSDDEAREFLDWVKLACNAYGALFVIDDVVMGFRAALGGSLERYGWQPDMVVLGKAMSMIGNVSAVIGRERLVGRLAEDVFYSSTFGGHPLHARIAARTVDCLAAHDHMIYGPSGHLQAIGAPLFHGLEEIFQRRGIPARMVGQYERSVAVFEDEAVRRRWCGLMIGAGIVVDRPFFPTLAHTPEHVAATLAAADAACAALAHA